jgi:signal recognition particle subunit SEC65
MENYQVRQLIQQELPLNLQQDSKKRHNRKAHRALVISPMVERRAREVARKLGIEVYSYAEDVDPALFS